MSQATNRRYDHDALLRINGRYDEEHTLTPEDVDAVNGVVVHIETSRSTTKPKPGDRLTFISRHGDYTTNALIEKEDEGGISVCINPYVPFVFSAQDGIHCDVSGGPFTSMTAADAKYTRDSHRIKTAAEIINTEIKGMHTLILRRDFIDTL